MKFTKDDINRIVQNAEGEQYVISAVSLGGTPILRKIQTSVDWDVVGSNIYLQEDNRLEFATELTARRVL